MPTFTVLIPFFQRETGLLRMAVESVLRQSVFGAASTHGDQSVVEGAVVEDEQDCGTSREDEVREAITAEILIVDDGSPVPPRDEIEGLELPAGVTIRIVERENGGVSAARNTGLDATDSSTRLLAIIDSDDVWSRCHLERALCAHRLGADIYTSNWIPVESEKDAFTFFGKLKPEHHRPLPGLEDAFEYVGDFAAQEIERSIGRPSALVFSWSKFGDLRNDSTLLHGSEDQLWRLHMSARRPTVIFSTRPEVRSGVGVSMFSGASWATVKGLLIARDRLACMRRARRDLDLGPDALAARRRVVASTRTDLVGVAMHLLLKGPRPGLGVLSSLVSSDPGLAFAWPLHVARVIGRRMGSSQDEAQNEAQANA